MTHTLLPSIFSLMTNTFTHENNSRILTCSYPGPQCDCTDLCFCHATPYKERLGSPIVPSPIATAGPHSIPETKSARTTPFLGAIISKTSGLPPDGRLSDTRFSFTHVPAVSVKLEDGSQIAPTVFRLASMRSSPRDSLDRSRESGISGTFLRSYSSQPRAVTPLPFPDANATQQQAPMPVQPAAQPVPTKNRFLYSKHWKETPVGASARMLSQEMKVESGWRNARRGDATRCCYSAAAAGTCARE